MRRSIRFLHAHHGVAAIVLAVLLAATGVRYGVRNAGGADSYGYVSEADLWLQGHLPVNQDFAADLPWPDAGWTLAPLGYRLVPGGPTIVPQYAPGLPLLMAAGKMLGGQLGMFEVVPLCSGLLVLATYAIGRESGRPLVGLAAAWLIATSPTVIHMTMWPMSDVPAAALWAIAVALALRDTRPTLTLSGVAAALAILVRPNLAPLAGVIGLWIVWAKPAILIARGAPAPRAGPRALWFAIPASVGAIFIAILNTRLYGSPLVSGYTDLSDLFSRSNIPGNLKRYASWLVSTETPLALAGLMALIVPSARLWRIASANRAHWLLAGCALAMWVLYLPYEQFDAWWYLRFLLPAWPMMAIGTATLLAALFHLRHQWAHWTATLLLVGLGVQGLTQVLHWRENALTFAGGESKYAETANAVRSVTSADAVILTEQHSGTVRYYGGRMTVRWNRMDPEWLDRAVAWLDAHGHHPYILVEDWEVARLTEKYGPANVVARLGWSPVVTLRNGAIRLYDAANREYHGPSMELPDALDNKCWPPVPAPAFRR